MIQVTTYVSTFTLFNSPPAPSLKREGKFKRKKQVFILLNRGEYYSK